MVTPREAKKLDTAMLCKILKIDIADVENRMKKCRNYSSYKASVFLKQISTETYATLSKRCLSCLVFMCNLEP